LEDPDHFKKIKTKVKIEQEEKNEKKPKMQLNKISNNTSNYKLELNENDKNSNPFDTINLFAGPSLDNFLDEIEGDEDIIEISFEEMEGKGQKNPNNNLNTKNTKKVALGGNNQF